MARIFEDETFINPTDIDRLGTLKMLISQWKWDPYEKLYTLVNSPLKLHSCTKDDV